MSTLSEQLRQLLALGEADGVRVLEEDPGPSTGVGLGLSEASHEPLAEIVRRRIPESPFFLDVNASKTLGFRRWAADPRIVVLEPGEASVTVFGASERAGLDYVLDSRQRPVFVSLQEGGDAVFVAFDAGRCEILTVELEPSAAMKALRDAPDPPPLQVVPPPFAELVAGLPCADWIQSEASLLAASPSFMDRVAAVGLVVRLWTPTGGDARVAAKRLLEGAASPGDRAAAWVRTLPRETLEDVEREALRDASGLAEDAALLVPILVRQPALLRDAVRQLARRRDDLESIRTILELGGGGTVLVAALRDADDGVTAHASVFSAVEVFDDDPRLRAVSWNEPTAWWGALALA